MKTRSDYRIVKYPTNCTDLGEGKDYFYRVDQRFLWFFWTKPDADYILAEMIFHYIGGYKKVYEFFSKEAAEVAIQKSLNWRKNNIEEVVG